MLRIGIIFVGIVFSSTLPNGMNDYINAIYAQDWKRGGSNLGTDLVNDESWTDPFFEKIFGDISLPEGAVTKRSVPAGANQIPYHSLLDFLDEQFNQEFGPDDVFMPFFVNPQSLDYRK